MSVTFRCKRSGNTVSFTNQDDIDGLRKHEGYDEVFENENVPTKEVEITAENSKEEVLTEKKKSGRPRKYRE